MKLGKYRRAFWCAAALLWAAFIWGNSLRTAGESTAQSMSVMEPLLPLLLRTGLAADVWHTAVRKMAHLTEFALLGALWSAALLPGREAALRARWMRRGVVLLICLLVAGVDETIQRFVPGRNGQIKDVCIDLLGGALGILLVSLAGCLWRKQATPKMKQDVQGRG